MSISPQGYNYQDDPKNVNPFFGQTPSPTPVQSRSIVSIIKTATVGLVDTYTITYTDNTTSSFTVTNGAQGAAGVGISDIRKTGTTGRVDTYTIYFSNNTTYSFTVTNGEKGEKGDAGVSPDILVREIVGGHLVTITDATGSEDFIIPNGTAGADGVTPVITITATQDGEPVTVTKTGTDAAPNFNIALTGGGGSASGTIGWGTYGAEVAGNYPRSKKEEHKLEQAFVVNESGTSTEWISGSHEYSWTLTGTLPADFVTDTKYTPEMTPSGTTGYIPSVYGDVSSYLTATITPQDEMTADNIRVRFTNAVVDSSNHQLQIGVEIKFDAHYNGTTMEGSVYPTLYVNAGGFTATTTYAYLEVLPEE